MKTKKLLSILIAFIMVLGIVPFMALPSFADEASGDTLTNNDEIVTCENAINVSSADGSYRLCLEKSTFKLGEPIMVTSYGKSTTDWVAICPKGAGTYPNYYYLGKSGSGAPYDIARGMQLVSGEYEIYLVPNNGRGYANHVVKTEIVITDEEFVGTYEYPTVDFGDEAYLSTKNGQRVFKKGEPIYISSEIGAPKDWIGVYSDVYDTSYSSYVYVENMGEEYDITKLQSFEAGNYLLRLIDKNAGKPYENTTLRGLYITVLDEEYKEEEELPEKTLSVNKTTFSPNEEILVTATGYGSDWVGIATADGTEAIMWYYVEAHNGKFGVGSGVEFNIREMAEKDSYYHGSGYKDLINIPVGEYVICFVENDGLLKNGALYTIPIKVVDDITEPENPSPEPDSEPDVPVDPNPDNPEGDDGASSVTVSNETHSLSVNKTRFNVGEPILVTATGVDVKDWIGIAQRGTREATVRWYYITDSGNGVPYDIRTAPNVGGNLGQLASLPEGLYTIFLVEKDQYLKNDFTFSINIAIGDVDDSENGKTEGGTIDEPTVPSQTQAPLSATYTLGGDGFASGTVSVTMPYGISGGYDIVMYWANESGALDGYTSLAKFKVTAETTSFTFDKNTVVPNGATKLLVYAKKSGDSPLSEGFVTVDLPAHADMEQLGTPDLSMVVISDIHISGLNDTSAVNFQNMLRDVARQYPSGVAIYIVGDMADNGRSDQYANMMTLHAGVMSELGKDGAKYPLYLAIGNHDYPSASGAFLEYATLPDGTHPTDTSYDFWLNGYHYIFLGSDTPSGLGAYFTPETLAWLDSKLGENRSESRPTFLFLHQSLYNTVAGSLPGEGWHGVTNDQELRAILAKYPEIMLFNGHSHWTMDSVSNMYGATEELPIHAFNCASVSYLWSGYNKVSGEHLDGSQGYIVEIYGNKIFVRGRDFSLCEWVASAQYLVQLKSCEHEYEITDIKYTNGYLASGTVTKECAKCGDTVEMDAPALIVYKGHSVAEYDTSSMVASYFVNYEWLEAYEAFIDTKIELGVVACASDNLVNKDNKPINSDGTTAKVTMGAVVSSKIDRAYSAVSVIMRTDNWEKYQDFDVIMCMYIIENGNVWYVSSNALTEAATTVTYNQAFTKQEDDE